MSGRPLLRLSLPARADAMAEMRRLLTETLARLRVGDRRKYRRAVA